MRVLGLSALGHDAAACVVDENRIIFAAHAERYSRTKNDPHLNQRLLDEALAVGRPDCIVWYEHPLLKRLRMLSVGQPGAFSSPTVRQHLRAHGLSGIPLHFVGHHHSHAAGGFYTAPFDEAAILVVDAIGEWDTVSIWHGQGTSLRKLWSQRYPHSLGLFYSAITQRCGFKPNEEEFIVMGMAAYGKPSFVERLKDEFIVDDEEDGFWLRRNLHRGLRRWCPELGPREDIAASAQQITEDVVLRLAEMAKRLTGCENLVLTGGVALNCVANSRIAREAGFRSIWIMPNPGDAGSALGAAAAWLRRSLAWAGPYLGHDIHRPLNIMKAVDALRRGEPVAIAHSRAEYGPRALGHRSLLLDPRLPDGQERINRVKRREPFRPFAPAILAEHASHHFDMPVPESPYMQFVAGVRHRGRYPAIEHIDGTARVQTVGDADSPAFRHLLTEWHRETGCPMLLNTSLNLKGEPLVNTWEEAERFAQVTGVTLC